MNGIKLERNLRNVKQRVSIRPSPKGEGNQLAFCKASFLSYVSIRPSPKGEGNRYSNLYWGALITVSIRPSPKGEGNLTILSIAASIFRFQSALHPKVKGIKVN